MQKTAAVELQWTSTLIWIFYLWELRVLYSSQIDILSVAWKKLISSESRKENWAVGERCCCHGIQASWELRKIYLSPEEPQLAGSVWISARKNKAALPLWKLQPRVDSLGMKASASTAAPLGKVQRHYTAPFNQYGFYLLLDFKQNYFINCWIFLSLCLHAKVTFTKAQLSCSHCKAHLHLLLTCSKWLP